MTRVLLSSLFVLSLSLLSPPKAEAQRYRYMDSSGNLHFVDSIGDIPRQYRQQVFPPTPTPVLNARQQNELKRAKEREIKERQRQIDKKKREIERVRRSIERDQKLQSGKGATLSVPSSPQKVAPREDDIEVIR